MKFSKLTLMAMALAFAGIAQAAEKDVTAEPKRGLVERGIAKLSSAPKAGARYILESSSTLRSAADKARSLAQGGTGLAQKFTNKAAKDSVCKKSVCILGRYATDVLSDKDLAYLAPLCKKACKRTGHPKAAEALGKFIKEHSAELGEDVDADDADTDDVEAAEEEEAV